MEGLGNPHRPQPRVEPAEQDRAGLLNSFKKLNPPMFNGDSNPQAAESWYKQIQHLLGSMKVQTNQDKIALATIQFEGEANHWWEMVSNSRQTEEMTWAQFEALFYEKYFLEPVKIQMAREFLSLTQGRMTVTQYANKFEMLSRYAPEMIGSESAKARKFEWELDQPLRRTIIALQLPTYTQVVDRAISLEKESEDARRISGQQFKNNQEKGGPNRNHGGRFNQGPYIKGKQ